MKIHNFILLVIAFFTINFCTAQSNEEILMRVDDVPIEASEFLRVYNKNLDLVKDESQKDIDTYLQLFVEYQLKLQEAKRLKLDEDAMYKREFQRYKKQLTKNYLSENKVTETLVKEAYERSGIDINASHVLVRLDETSKDTINAYNDVLALRNRILEEGFEEVKKDVHDGKSIFLEDLGYFSAFKMVYDFETAAYNTPVGQISMPFRTQFGYHAVLVKDKRPSRGTITAAHIMIALKQKDSTVVPEQRIQEIYTKLKQGDSFESLAKQFSDDKSSARNGGALAPFKSGQLNSVAFEDQAFSLRNNGDVSEPFKTDYGWHIVKRIKLEPLKDFKELKPSLENRVKRDSRSKLINTAMVDELKRRYDIIYENGCKKYFNSIITDEFFKNSWKMPDSIDKDKMIFKINNRTFTYGQFGGFLTAAQRKYFNKEIPVKIIVDNAYDDFFEKSILKFREDNLELENEEFANILKEYRDGLLLFDLMEKEIWNKASKDTLGLKAYYEKNKSNYRWDKRVDMVMASSSKKEIVIKAKKMMEKLKPEDEISKALNTDEVQNIIFTKGIYTINDSKLPADLNFVEGISKVYNHNEAFHVLDVKEILSEDIKTFEEARGSVINDYQTELETEWLDGLKSRFSVEIKQDVLNRIKTQVKG
ncbi:peptidylprolyl isomerase [Winogradskyella aurantia]|uniref:Peptidylprolyl isomerase n=2 Tax=Winogradskyella aurantia TaxID=1915063 RepID=A0A265UQU7_9FLAO|nr:peptidylprolyl isomerase [Winogradskyella aurantia]